MSAAEACHRDKGSDRRLSFPQCVGRGREIVYVSVLSNDGCGRRSAAGSLLWEYHPSSLSLLVFQLCLTQNDLVSLDGTPAVNDNRTHAISLSGKFISRGLAFYPLGFGKRPSTAH